MPFSWAPCTWTSISDIPEAPLGLFGSPRTSCIDFIVFQLQAGKRGSLSFDYLWSLHDAWERYPEDSMELILRFSNCSIHPLVIFFGFGCI